MKTKYYFIVRNLFFILLVAILLLFTLAPATIYAAQMRNVSDTLSRLKVSTLSSHSFSFDLHSNNSFAAGETITIDFNEDGSAFVVSGAASTTSDFSFNDGTARTIYNVGSTTNCTGSTGVNDISVGINDTTGVVTFLACPSYTASSLGATVAVNYGVSAGGTNRVTNPSSAATYIIEIAGTNGDRGRLAVAILTDDQYVVTGKVDPTLTFTLSANATDFGSISSTSATTSSPNIVCTISTNAANGYSITVQDTGDGTTNPGLYNTPATFIIGSADYSYNNTADLSSVAGYGIQASSASATINARYNQSGDTVGKLQLTPYNLATYTSRASSHTVTITSKARVTGDTPAGDYTDTVTVIATGNF